MFYPLAYLGTFLTILILPGVRDFVLNILRIGAGVSLRTLKLGSRTARRTYRRMRTLLIALGIIYAFLTVCLTIAIAKQWTTAVIVVSLMLVMLAFFIFHPLQWLWKKMNWGAMTPMSIIVLLPTVPLMMALMYPEGFYGAFARYYLGLFMVGVVTNVLGALRLSDRFYTPYVLAGHVVAIFLLFCVTLILPQQVRAAEVGYQINQSETGRGNLAKELSVRPVNKVTSAKAYLWHITKHDNGQLDYSRVMVKTATGKIEQAYLSNGNAFKTVNYQAVSIMGGDPMIAIFAADPETGVYLAPPDKPEDWVYTRASDTDVPTSPEVSSNNTSAAPASDEPATPSGWVEVSRGTIDVSQGQTSVGSYDGRVLVLMWGHAVLHKNGQPSTPAGWNVPAEAGYALPGAPVFSSLAWFNGSANPARVGLRGEFDFTSLTSVSLGPNEDLSRKYGDGLADNHGSYSYKICKPGKP